ncbi:MAG: alpha/beta hydrolase [Planctomycetota bacterium]|nr:alpha/beta hydrolase [Planctomycetota bacterium]
MDHTNRSSQSTPDKSPDASGLHERTGTVTTPDGRQLAYLEVGDPHGPLVLHNHGGPGSRLEARLFAAVAMKHRLRLLCIDRPGFGQSSPQPSRSFADWATDLTTVADALGYRQFGVTGWSEGGPWALAAAAYIAPDRLRHVSSIAPACYGTFGENWAAKHLSKADALGGFLALHFEPGFRLMYATIGLTAQHFRQTYYRSLIKAVNDYDREVLHRPGIEIPFCEESAECFAQGSEGLILDSELIYRQWTFDVTTIRRAHDGNIVTPVHLWQGTTDTLVPAVINEEVASRSPGIRLHSVRNGGHFIAIGEAERIFGIAKEELG